MMLQKRCHVNWKTAGFRNRGTVRRTTTEIGNNRNEWIFDSRCLVSSLFALVKNGGNENTAELSTQIKVVSVSGSYGSALD
jgi:hypothetical protein